MQGPVREDIRGSYQDRHKNLYKIMQGSLGEDLMRISTDLLIRTCARLWKDPLEDSSRICPSS